MANVRMRSWWSSSDSHEINCIAEVSRGRTSYSAISYVLASRWACVGHREWMRVCSSLLSHFKGIRTCVPGSMCHNPYKASYWNSDLKTFPLVYLLDVYTVFFSLSLSLSRGCSFSAASAPFVSLHFSHCMMVRHTSASLTHTLSLTDSLSLTHSHRQNKAELFIMFSPFTFAHSMANYSFTWNAYLSWQLNLWSISVFVYKLYYFFTAARLRNHPTNNA